MTTTLLWLAIIALALGIVFLERAVARLERAQRQLGVAMVANAELTASLANQMAANAKTNHEWMVVQRDMNRAVLGLLGVDTPPEGPARTTKPALHLVPNDESTAGRP